MRKSRPNRGPCVPIILLVGGLATAAPALARPYMTPEFMIKTSRPQRVALLPAQAEFIKNQAVMTAEMVQEAAALEDAAARAIEAQLEGKGYAVRLVTPKDFDDAPGLRDLVTGLNGRYDEEWSRILRKPKDVRKGRFSAGEHVAEICTLLGVDGLIVARIVASAPTGGRQALTILLSLGQAYAQGYSNIGLGVLHGKSGRVEGYFNGSTTCTLGGLVKKPDKVMSRLVENALDDYPGSAEVLTPKKESEVVEAKSGAEEKSDEAAIEDFEAVLKQKGGAAPGPEETPAATVQPASAPQAAPSPEATPEPQATPVPEATHEPQATPAPPVPQPAPGR